MAQSKKDQPISVDQPGIYRFKIQGRLSEGAIRRFDELEVSVGPNAKGVLITTLTGQIADQAALHGVVARVRDLGLPLILVELLGPVDQVDAGG